MKYLLILFTVFTFGQASNQMVTFTQASTLGLTLNSGQAHVTSNQCMTKSAALAKYNLNASFMSEYIDNQLVPRSVWTNENTSNSFIFSNNTFKDRVLSCDNANTGQTLYSSSTSLAINVNLFADSPLGFPFNPFGNDTTRDFWIKSTTFSYRLSPTYSGSTLTQCRIVEIVDCSSPIVEYAQLWERSNAQIYSEMNCNVNYPIGANIYVGRYSPNGSYLSIGMKVYNNIDLTDAFNGSESGFLFVRQGERYLVKINASGVITDLFDCNNIPQ
jgi:hypothetical protein